MGTGYAPWQVHFDMVGRIERRAQEAKQGDTC